MRALASSDSRADRAIRVDSIASCARRRPFGRRPLGFHPHIVGFDVELGERFGHAIARRRCVLQRVTQRRRRIDRRKHFAARGFDVGFETLDFAVRRLVGLRLGRQRRRRLIALRRGGGGRLAASRQRCARRFAAHLERLELGLHGVGPRGQRLDLLAIERTLLLLPGDGELAGMRRLARGRGARLGLGELDAQAPEIRLDFGHVRGRERLALARVAQPCARGPDDVCELAILPREEDFFPAAQLVAQLLIPARLRRLPLQRAALLLHLEDDVVDAREILPGGFELQLRRAAARLVLGHAGRFLNQLTAIGRPRAQDHADLALLDDRVGLRAQAGVHQQIVDVSQPAHLTVDQVFAFARAVQPPGHFDFARD